MSLADQGSGMVRERLPGSSSRLTAAARRPAARELAPLRRAINPAPDQVTAVLPGWSPDRDRMDSISELAYGLVAAFFRDQWKSARRPRSAGAPYWPNRAASAHSRARNPEPGRWRSGPGGDGRLQGPGAGQSTGSPSAAAGAGVGDIAEARAVVTMLNPWPGAQVKLMVDIVEKKVTDPAPAQTATASMP